MRGFLFFFSFLFLFFFSPLFYNHTCSIWKFRPMPQPQQHQIWCVQPHATACSNTGSLSQWTRSGIHPASSWMLCWVLNPLSPNRNSEAFFSLVYFVEISNSHFCLTHLFFSWLLHFLSQLILSFLIVIMTLTDSLIAAKKKTPNYQIPWREKTRGQGSSFLKASLQCFILSRVLFTSMHRVPTEIPEPVCSVLEENWACI